MKPRSASAADRWRWLLLTHSRAASGSPRIDDCTNSFKAAKSPGWVSIAGLPPPPARRTRRADLHGARPQVRQATTDRAARNPGCPRNRHHPAVTGRARFARREQPPPSLVQDRRKRIEASLDGSGVDHAGQDRRSSRRITPISRFVRCVLAALPILFFRFGCPGSGP